MRILIVTTFFPPLNSIASLRPYSWAKYWSASGHDVTVLTTLKQASVQTDLRLPTAAFNVMEIPGPSFLTGMKKKYQSETSSPADRARDQPSWQRRFKNGLYALFENLRHKKGIFNGCRMPDFADLWIRPAIKAVDEQGRWDLVVSTAGPYATHIVAASLKKKGVATRWIADYRDTWSDNYIYPGIFPFNALEAFLERRLLRHADAITTVSQPFADHFQSKYPHVPAHAIENGFDPDDLAALDPAPIFPDDGKYRIVHTGTIYAGKRDPAPLFKALALLREQPDMRALMDRLEVLFVGPNQGNVAALIREHCVERWVKMLGPLPRDHALRMQRDAHLLLFLPWTDTSIDGVLTGKIFEYLFSKTPILAVGSPAPEASQKLIVEGGAGVAFHHTKDIASFLAQQLKAPCTMHKNQLDPNFLNRYNREFLAQKILQCVP